MGRSPCDMDPIMDLHVGIILLLLMIPLELFLAHTKDGVRAP